MHNMIELENGSLALVGSMDDMLYLVDRYLGIEAREALEDMISDMEEQHQDTLDQIRDEAEVLSEKVGDDYDLSDMVDKIIALACGEEEDDGV